MKRIKGKRMDTAAFFRSTAQTCQMTVHLAGYIHLSGGLNLVFTWCFLVAPRSARIYRATRGSSRFSASPLFSSASNPPWLVRARFRNPSPFEENGIYLLRHPVGFAWLANGIELRDYQCKVMRALVRSVIQRQGLSFVVMFPRQSGKNELQAQIESYLLFLLQDSDAEIVKVSPTWKPQSLNAMRRLERVLGKNKLLADLWKKESGYIYTCGSARVIFLSGSPETNIVGATASTLLEVDEAQDISIAKFDKDIAPMAASTNATRVFWGTAWTSRTLLARELRAALLAQQKDGIVRVFRITADDVAAEVPAYGKFVAEQVARLGRQNPMIRTQYFSEEIDAEGGMFPAARRLLMQAQQARSPAPAAGGVYCLLLDVAGEDESASVASASVAGASVAGASMAGVKADTLRNPGRDSTALTIVEVDLSTLADPVLKAPTYRVVYRQTWTGVKHAALYSQVKTLAETWKARHIVIDATGVGAGLSSFLAKAFGEPRVLPFVFSQKSKSDLGWSFLGIIDSGRFKDYTTADVERQQFEQQLDFCAYEVLEGPGKIMRWGVPDGTRDPATGELVHDDLVLSAALAAVLDGQPWASSAPAVEVKARDPLTDMSKGW
jgi:hypothetical protein